MSYRIRCLIVSTFMLCGLLFHPALADTTDLQVLDRATGEPISGATYKIGSVSGITDAAGSLRFVHTQGDTLSLSHITYGNWFLTGGKLVEAIASRTTYRLKQEILLQPVTVVAVRQSHSSAERLGIDTGDRLSHDAGTILSQTSVISGIQKSGGYGFDPVMRGFKNDQLNIVIDGAQCASAACPNRMDPPTSQVSPNRMRNVEILKGPHALRYGASFGGTINFETVDPRFPDRQEVYGRLSSSTESNDGVYRSEGLVGIRGAEFDLAFLGAYSQGDDYEDGEGVTIPASYERASYGITLGIQPSSKQNLSFSVTHNRASDTLFPALPMDLRSDKTWLLNAKHKIHVGGDLLETWSTTAYATYVDHLMDNLGKALNPRMLNATTDAETLNLGGRTEGVWSWDDTRLYTGMDLRVEQADGERTRDFLMGPMKGRIVRDNVWNDGRIFRSGVFAEFHRSFDASRIVLSGRLDYTDATARDLDPGFASKNLESDRSDLNPSISVGGVRYLDKGASVGLWLGRAQRSASLTESYINSFPVGVDPYDMLGNPSLKPEVNNQIDLNLGYQTARTSIDVSLFAALLQDYISSEIDPGLAPTMPSSPGVRRYSNIDDALMAGFEASWSQELSASFEHNVSLAYTYGKDRTLDAPLPEIAPLDVRMALSGRFVDDRMRSVVSLRHVLEQNRVSTAFGETATPSFTVVDVGVSYQVREGVNVNGGIRNLFDEAYFEHLARPVRGQQRAIFAPGRNAYLTVALDAM